MVGKGDTDDLKKNRQDGEGSVRADTVGGFHRLRCDIARVGRTVLIELFGVQFGARFGAGIRCPQR